MSVLQSKVTTVLVTSTGRLYRVCVLWLRVGFLEDTNLDLREERHKLKAACYGLENTYSGSSTAGWREEGHATRLEQAQGGVVLVKMSILLTTASLVPP